jgi:hypothetical protein
MTKQNRGGGSVPDGLLRVAGCANFLFPHNNSSREMRRAAERREKRERKQQQQHTVRKGF